MTRSEHLYHGDATDRPTLRKHFFEYETPGGEQEPVDAKTLLTLRRWLKLQTCSKQFKKAFKQLIKQTKQAIESETPPRLGDFLDAIENLAAPGLQDPEIRDSLGIVLRNPLRCRAIHESDKFARYLGFVDLRLHSTERGKIAMALLVPPRRLRYPRQVQLITGNYGPIFGGEGFQCTVYSQHDLQTSGARCAQASLIMALAMLSDRGAQIKGSYTLTYLGKRSSVKRKDHAPPPELRDRNGNLVSNYTSIPVNGLNLEEMHEMLQSNEFSVRASKNLVDLSQHQHRSSNIRKISRLIRAHVLTRFPVILLVNVEKAGGWWPQPDSDLPQPQESSHPQPAVREPAPAEPEQAGKDPRHAVVIIGYRQCQPNPQNPHARAAPGAFSGSLELSHLITHDPGYIPFYEVDFPRALESARMLQEDTVTEDGEPWPYNQHAQMLMVTGNKISVPAERCLAALDAALTRNSGQYQLWGLVRDPEHAILFLGDYEIVLLRREEIEQYLYPDPVYPSMQPDGAVCLELDNLRTGLEKLPPQNGWYWVVIAYRGNPETPELQRAERLWLFDVTHQLPGPESLPAITGDIPLV